jgi:hypothetical protein
MTELQDLRLELAAQKALKEDWKKAAGERLDEITRLRAEVEELREDKARLDFVQSSGYRIRSARSGDGQLFTLVGPRISTGWHRNLRAVIDAARDGG